jgi:hypothetical protein
MSSGMLRQTLILALGVGLGWPLQSPQPAVRESIALWAAAG